LDQTEHFPVVIIGGGQAGLAAGYFLSRASVPYVIIEAAARFGESWWNRWDSLTLFTPACYSALPGLPFPGDPWRFPRKDEVAEYLERYVERFRLPVRRGARVTSLSRPDDGGYLIQTSGGGAYRTDAVIVATGAFQRPRLPAFASELAPEVRQLHSSRYRNPEQFEDGTVLVVGAGNSGVQIAAELATVARVHLAVGSRQPPLPRRLLGRDVFWWLDHLGIVRSPCFGGDGDVLVGNRIGRLVRRARVVRHPRAVGASGRSVTFADDGSLEVTGVVWATGFRPDYGWLEVPVLDADGRPVHKRGVTSSPGLCFLGLKNQYSSGSSLIGWVKADAKFVVANIVDGLRTSQQLV
jgi:putative flavoprotein involved in K+ transport